MAEANGDANANRNVASTWETFTVVDKGNGNFAFKSHHGKYLVAESNGDLNANRINADIWETFKVEKAEESVGTVQNYSCICLFSTFSQISGKPDFSQKIQIRHFSSIMIP